MSAKTHESTERAVQAYAAGAALTAAAAAEGIAPSTLSRALDRAEVPKRGAVRGPAHHAYGKTSPARKSVTRQA